MWVYDGSLSLNVSRARCSLFTKHSYHHRHDDHGIRSFKSIVTVLVFTPSVTHNSLTQRAHRRFGLVSFKLTLIWTSKGFSGDDDVIDNPEDDARDDGEGGADDDQDWGERGSGVRGSLEILRVETP